MFKAFIAITGSIAFFCFAACTVYAAYWIPWPELTWTTLTGDKSFIELAATIVTPLGLLGGAVAFGVNAFNSRTTAMAARHTENTERFVKGVELLASEREVAQAAGIAMIARSAAVPPFDHLKAARAALSTYVMTTNLPLVEKARADLANGVDYRRMLPAVLPANRAIFTLGALHREIAGKIPDIQKHATINSFYSVNVSFDDIHISNVRLKRCLLIGCTFANCTFKDAAIYGEFHDITFLRCKFEDWVDFEIYDDEDTVIAPGTRVQFVECEGMENLTINDRPAAEWVLPDDEETRAGGNGD